MALTSAWFQRPPRNGACFRLENSSRHVGLACMTSAARTKTKNSDPKKLKLFKIPAAAVAGQISFRCLRGSVGIAALLWFDSPLVREQASSGGADEKKMLVKSAST